MRYFFNLRHSGRVTADDIGMDFETLEEAKEHARIVAAEISRHTNGRYADTLLCICDPAGTHITAFHVVASEDGAHVDGRAARPAG
jgi:hypothetical protein